MDLVAWALTTGEAGMRSQARGLAQAVSSHVVEKVVERRPVWPWVGALIDCGLEPPWPDLIISCGRRAAGLALAVGKASQGKTFTVHVQDPRWRASAFDLVVAMGHDRIDEGPNILKATTALHDITPSALADAANAWRDRFARLGRPLIGVVLGGDLKGRAFTGADGERLLAGLRRIRNSTGAGVAITPSRRTPISVREMVERAFRDDGRAYLWDLQGDNPYRAILALSDQLIVTSDSVSMVSEALASPHPVEVFDLGFPRHRGFIQSLVDRNWVRRFDGEATPIQDRQPINATFDIARVVSERLQARTGRSG